MNSARPDRLQRDDPPMAPRRRRRVRCFFGYHQGLAIGGVGLCFHCGHCIALHPEQRQDQPA
jgi:hypothetical protein